MKSKKNNKKKGRFGELYALLFLILKGYNLLKRNYTTNSGEIDIIMQKKDVIVFIEVKYRSKDYGIRPAEAVNYNKKRHIKKASEVFIKKGDYYNYSFRYDIIEIIGLKINHIVNAF